MKNYTKDSIDKELEEIVSKSNKIQNKIKKIPIKRFIIVFWVLTIITPVVFIIQNQILNAVIFLFLWFNLNNRITFISTTESLIRELENLSRRENELLNIKQDMNE